MKWLMDTFDTKQFLTGLACLVVGGVLHFIWTVFNEWRRRVVFACEGWKVEYPETTASGELVYSTTPRKGVTAEFRVMARFYNTKSKSVGLHKFGVVFSKGGISRRKWFRRVLLTVDHLKHGPAKWTDAKVWYRQN